MTSESGACLTEPNKEQSPASGDCILDKLSDHSTAESHIATLNAVDSNHYNSTSDYGGAYSGAYAWELAVVTVIESQSSFRLSFILTYCQ